MTLGGGGLVAVQAASSASSSVVTINPTVRVLDTRPDSNVGLSGPFERGVSRTLQLTGSIATTTGAQVVVPAGATGVMLNVTVVCLARSGVVCPGGFLAVRPGDAVGQTSTSSLNFVAGDIVPNSVQVGLSAAGQVDIVYGPYVAGAQVDVLVDVVGYMVAVPSAPPAETTQVRAISLPAHSLNAVDTAVITRVVSGLRFTNSSSGAATLAVRRPPDWTGDAQVIVKIVYTRDTTAAGGVQFFIRPRDFNPGDPFADEVGIMSDTDMNAGLQYREATIVIPPATLQKATWELVIQRNSGFVGAYPDDVIVRSVEVSYLAIN